MTSFVLKSVMDRLSSYPPLDDHCTFCRIITDRDEAFVVYEDQQCMAFLDIYPIRPGHTLLIPKQHYSKLSELPGSLGEAMGRALPKVTKAITEATGNPDLNVVCNQGYAQAVHHVHWHLIPAPQFDQPVVPPKPKPSKSHQGQEAPPTHQYMLRGEMANRDFLDDDDAAVLVDKIKSRL